MKNINENQIIQNQILYKFLLSKMIAKPKSKNNYCNVCKNDYDDYLEVITYLLSTSNQVNIN